MVGGVVGRIRNKLMVGAWEWSGVEWSEGGVAIRILIKVQSHLNQNKAFVLAFGWEVGPLSPHIVCIRTKGGVATPPISKGWLAWAELDWQRNF